MTIKKWSVNNLEQLALGLEVEETPEADEATGHIPTPDEARLRSETARAALEIAGTQSAPAWLETYHRLLDTGWPWRVACYIAWAASPKIRRQPATQQELAIRVLGLTSDRQIATWRKRNPTIDQAIAMMQAAPLMDHRADVFAALAAAASDPDHRSNPDRKLFLSMTGDYTERIRIDDRRTEGLDDLSNYSEAELAQMAGKAAKPAAGPEEAGIEPAQE